VATAAALTAAALVGLAVAPAAATPMPLPLGEGRPSALVLPTRTAAPAAADGTLLDLARTLDVPYSAIGTDAAKGRAGVVTFPGPSSAATP